MSLRCHAQCVLHVQHCRGAQNVAERIANVDGVVTGVSMLHIGKLQRRGGRPVDVHPVEPPLILERCAGGLHSKRHRLSGNPERTHRLADNLRCSLRIEVDVAAPVQRFQRCDPESLPCSQSRLVRAPCTVGVGRRCPIAGGVVEQAHLQTLGGWQLKIGRHFPGKRERCRMVRIPNRDRRRQAALRDLTGKLQRHCRAGFVVKQSSLARRNR